MTQLHSREVTLALGAKLGSMIQDTEKRDELVQNLAAGGAATVYADTADTVHLVVPSSIDAERMNDDAYLEELGRRALGACFYEILPE